LSLASAQSLKSNYAEHTPAVGTTTASPLTPEEWALNAQLKMVYKCELNKFHDHQEKAASDILAHLSRS
jgi:hypothetical protein